MPTTACTYFLRGRKGQADICLRTCGISPLTVVVVLPWSSQLYTEIDCFVDLRDGSRVMETQISADSGAAMSTEVSRCVHGVSQ